jgi:hypothetical protein
MQMVNRVQRGLKRRFGHWQNNRQIDQLEREVFTHAPHPSAAPVVFFNASTRLGGVSLNAAYSLLTALALRLNGAPVAHFVCQSGLTPCVLGTNRDDPHSVPPCAECIAQSNVLTKGANTRSLIPIQMPEMESALAGLSVQEMLDFGWRGAPLGRLTLPALRWVLRRHHLLDDEPTRYLFRQYLISAGRVAQQFGAFLDEVKPQAVVVFNGQFYPEATARWSGQQRGLRVISHEIGLRPFTAYFTDGDATAYPIHIPDSFELSASQNQKLDAYLEQRFQGNFSMGGVRFWPEMRPLSQQFLEKAAEFEQIVPVFTNVIFDTSQVHANTLFEHMFAWLDDTLGLVRRHPETLFVIRAHPDESRPGKASRETVADWVKRSSADTLPNVIFVDSGEYLSSYELIQRSKFVMIYNSTIGLEASLMGAAVLCAGRARFTQLSTVFFPQTQADYHRQAEQMLIAKMIEIPAEFQRNARRFLYYQLYRVSLPLEDLMQEDGIWRGYVRLKPGLTWDDLLLENSPTLKVAVEGILHGTPFEMNA